MIEDLQQVKKKKIPNFEIKLKKLQTFLFCLIFSCYSQEPVKWDFAVSDIKNGELKLTIRAEIDKN